MSKRWRAGRERGSRRGARRPGTPREAAGCVRPVDEWLDAGVFRALGEPTRALLFACIAKCGRACSVGEVAGCCAVDLSVVSRHLALMAAAGVLEAKKEGRTVRYGVRYGALCGALRSLADAIEECGAGCGEACAGGCCGKA